MAKPNARRQHVPGQSVEREEHGLYKTAEYRAYRHVLDRCYNPNSKVFHHYGGRSIAVCAEWRASFCQFYADMGQKPTPKHELERINNEAGYSPDNCRWATRAEQCSNTRVCYRITINGATRTATEWGKLNGLGKSTVLTRIHRGWPVIRAVTEPSKYPERSRR